MAGEEKVAEDSLDFLHFKDLKNERSVSLRSSLQYLLEVEDGPDFSEVILSGFVTPHMAILVDKDCSIVVFSQRMRSMIEEHLMAGDDKDRLVFGPDPEGKLTALSLEMFPKGLLDKDPVEVPKNESIEKAAVKSIGGKVYSVDRPGRHDAALALLYKSEEVAPYRERSVQGFVTSTGRFVDRIEGAELAIKAGQIEKLNWPPQLYSEDLW